MSRKGLAVSAIPERLPEQYFHLIDDGCIKERRHHFTIMHNAGAILAKPVPYVYIRSRNYFTPQGERN